MKIKNKKEFIIPTIVGSVLAFSFFFFSFKNVKAETISFQQIVTSTTTSNNLSGFQSLGIPSVLGQTINTVQLIFKNLDQSNNSISRINLGICSTQWTDQNICAATGNASGDLGTIAGNNIQTNIGTYTDYQPVNFTFSATTTKTGYYKFEWLPVSFGNYTKLGSSNLNSYPEGQWRVFPAVNYQDDVSVKDLYFKIGNNLELLSSNFIRITYPHNGEVVGNFPYWFVDYAIATTTDPAFPGFPINPIQINVQYATSTNALGTSLAYTDGFDVLFLENGTASTTIARQGALPIGDYYAQGFITSTNRTTGVAYVIATSTIISFTMASSTPGNLPWLDFPLNNIATTSTDFFVRCNEVMGNDNIFLSFWGKGFCNAMKFLFQPTQGFMDDLKFRLLGFTNIFPFSIVFSFNQTMQQAVNVTPQGESLSIQLPTGASVTILSPTILEDTIGLSTKNKIFEIQKNLIWLATGLLILRKLVSKFT